MEVKADGMQQREELDPLQLHLRSLLEKGSLLRVHLLPPQDEGTAGLRVFGKSRSHLRPVLRALRAPRPEREDLADRNSLQLVRISMRRRVHFYLPVLNAEPLNTIVIVK